MGKFAIAVHGGAGPDSRHIKENFEGYKKGLEEALKRGYAILESGGSALEAVEAAVNSLEDNPLFNAGRGSALNEKAEAEMGASIVDGKTQKCGAVGIVKNVKNPVSLAKAVLEKTSHTYIGATGALNFAMQVNAPLEPDAYFVTDHQLETYMEARNKSPKDPAAALEAQLKRRLHGTVGAVALDAEGNLAAATSTGGTEFCKEGRIADSSMVGVGSYANNRTCAVSATGDGEYIMKYTTAFHLSALIDYKGLSLEEAGEFFMNEKFKDEEGDLGFIAIDPHANITMKFKAERMHRGFRKSTGEMEIEIY